MVINENNFIKQLKIKNSKALDYAVDIYSPLVKGIVSRTLVSFGNIGIIDECISDVFMAIWNNCEKFNGDNKKFKSWIGAIAKFKAVDYYRKNSKSLNNEAMDENITNGKSTEDDFMIEVESNKLISIISEFDEPDRSIFVRKFLLEQKSKIISKDLGLTVSNINTRISRGRDKIKNQFYKECKEVF